MANEPERDIEKTLKAYADRRRSEAGPLELHGATRRMLQAEAARVHGAKDERGLFATVLAALVRRRLAFAAALAALVVVSAAVFLVQFHHAGRQTALADGRQMAARKLTPASDAPSTFQQAEATREAESRRDGFAPTNTPVATAAPAAAPPVVALDQSEKALAVGVPNASTAIAANDKSSPARDARTLDAPSSSAFAPGGAARNETPIAPATPPPTTLADSAQAGSQPASMPADKVAAPVQGPALFAKQGYYSSQTNDAAARLFKDEAVPGNSAASQVAAAPVAATAPASAPATSALGGLAAASTPPAAADGKPVSRLAASSPGRQFHRLDLGAANRQQAKSAKAGILNSFRFEQTGQTIRVIDSDGSVYTGSEQPSESTATAAKQFGAAPAPVAPAYFFRVTGTNRTSRQPVVFSGTIMPVVAAAAAAARPESPRRAAEDFSAPPSEALVRGRVRIGTNEFELNAGTASP